MTAEKVATSFIYAYGAFDVERATTYLADDADISGMMESVEAEGVEGTLDEFRLLISLLEAQGYKQMLNSCQEQGSSAVRHERLSAITISTSSGPIRSTGEPLSGSFFVFAVRDGSIVRAWGVCPGSPGKVQPADVGALRGVGLLDVSEGRRRHVPGRDNGPRRPVLAGVDPALGAAHPGVRGGRRPPRSWRSPRASWRPATPTTPRRPCRCSPTTAATALLMDDNRMERYMPTLRLDQRRARAGARSGAALRGSIRVLRVSTRGLPSDGSGANDSANVICSYLDGLEIEAARRLSAGGVEPSVSGSTVAGSTY